MLTAVTGPALAWICAMLGSCLKVHKSVLQNSMEPPCQHVCGGGGGAVCGPRPTCLAQTCMGLWGAGEK